MPNQNRIERTNFLTLKGLTFSFSMTDHLNPMMTEDFILTEICKTISDVYQKNVFPIWARLFQGHRIFVVTPCHRLYKYLDDDSRMKFFNWLIFKRYGDHISVTHFGPFGNVKEKEFRNTQDKTDRALAILKKMWKALKSPENKSSEKDKERKLNYIKDDLRRNYWAVVERIKLKIESKKREFADLIRSIYAGDGATTEEMIRKLMSSTGRTVINMIIRDIITTLLLAVAEKAATKLATKTATKVAAKKAAKTAAKTGSKMSGKASAKAVPLLGLGAGIGFGIWRLCHGDVAGAGLEVASGAASCVPGGGTATSLAIEAALIAKDTIEARALSQRRAHVSTVCYIHMLNIILTAWMAFRNSEGSRH